MYTIGLLFADESVESWRGNIGTIQNESFGDILSSLALELKRPDLDWSEMPIGFYVFNSYNRNDTVYYGIEIIPATVNFLEV